MKLKIAKAKSLVDSVGLATQLRAQYADDHTGALYNHTSGAWEAESAFTGAKESQSFSTAFAVSGEGNRFTQDIPALVLSCPNPVVVALYDPADLTVGLIFGVLDKKTGHVFNPGLMPIGADQRVKTSSYPG